MKVVYSDKHLLHDTRQVLYDGHPFELEEVPERAEIILNALQVAGYTPPAAPSDHGLQPILAVHAPDYVAYLQGIYTAYASHYQEETAVIPETFAHRRSRRKPEDLVFLPGYYAFGIGSPMLAGTWQAAYWSAQCALTAAGLLLEGEPAAYALCRPPGHHAGPDFYGGFCYLNNAAIAARFLQDSAPPEWQPVDQNVPAPPQHPPVAILDIDFHHGNGTQEIFYTDASVLFTSLHADPDLDYPFFWGGVAETGEPPGEGFNRNWPLPLGVDDARYLDTLDEALAVIANFAPRYLVVSLGLDIAAGDPVGGFQVSASGLHEIARRIARLGLPILAVQEGGYLLDSLGDLALAFLSGLP